jgi:hypothetical protein
MPAVRFFLAVAFAALLAGAAVRVSAHPLPAAPPARPLITQAINPAQAVELPGNVRPEILDAANDRGEVPDDFPMPGLLLQLARPDEREQALATLLDEQQDPDSPNYRNWIGATDFGALYGPAQQDVDAVVAWLQVQGFSVDRVYESGMTIAFSATAGQVRRAFAAPIHFVEAGGRMHYANARNPRIPRAFAPAVRGIVALHDFKPRPNATPRLAPEYTISTDTHAVVPADLATIYGLTSLFSANTKGQGQTIALVEDSNVFSTADITRFRSVFGLGTATFTQVHPDCTSPGVVPGDDGEATLDVEWAAAAAPGATLQLVSCANLFDAVANLVNANATPPAIMSISFGACEAELGAAANAFISTTYQQAAAKGISVFVSSGDEGAAGCDNGASKATHGIGVNGLASTVYNVAVGGTDFGDTFAGTTSTYWNTTNTSTFGSAKSYINEIPWNNSCASQLLASFAGFANTYGSSGFCNSATGANFLTTGSGSGGPSACASGAPSTSGVVGGSCAGRAKPSWQSGLVGNPADGVRDLPDLSLFAANGLWGHYYVYCFSDVAAGGASCTGAPSTWAGAGGTSFSAPILAGIQALVNHKNGIALAGNPNPAYYQLAKSAYGASGSTACNSIKGNAIGGSCVFRDITQGDMDVNCAGGSPNCYRPSGTNGVLSTSPSSYLPAYKTATGWDFATGIGSINAANLAANWPVATKLAFTTQPASGSPGVALATIRVSVENAGGGVVAGNTSAVTLKFGTNPTGATLGGTLTVNAVDGVAAFNNVTVNKAGTGYTLVATASNLTSATSSAFNIVSVAPAKLAFSTQPPASVASNGAFSLAVAVEDAGGNVVTGSSSAVTLALTAAIGATLAGTKSKAAASGIATFSGLSIDKAGSYTLTATDGALTAADSTTITVTPGAATQLAFTMQPPASSVSGAAFGAAVTIRDAAGNTVTSNVSSVHVALTTANGASLDGTTTRGAVAGVAAFSGLSVAKAGTYTLTAIDGSLAATTSSAFTITPGPPARLVFTTQPTSLLAGTKTSATVSIQDSAGNIETADNATPVSVSIGRCGGTPLATATVAAGVAQFQALRFYTVGTGLQLLAQASGISTALSSTFNVAANGDLLFADEFAGCTP